MECKIMSFRNQIQRVATEEDINAPWSGVKGGKHFYCYLCGYKFQIGDKWRWVNTAYRSHRSNLLVCEECDGPNVLECWEVWWKEWESLAQGKFRYIADMLEDA